MVNDVTLLKRHGNAKRLRGSTGVWDEINNVASTNQVVGVSGSRLIYNSSPGGEPSEEGRFFNDLTEE